MPSHLIAIDQGTTSTRAIVFDAALAPVAHRAAGVARRSIRRRAGSSTIRRKSGRPWSRPCARRWRRPASAPRISPASASPTSARPRSSGTAQPASRSTTPSSGRTGAPPTPARRCAPPATRPRSPSKTGLLLDPYFSATKIAWLLDHVSGARAAAEQGRLAFGTVDSFLLWRLTGGKVHATDATNASRTLLFDIAPRRNGIDELLRAVRRAGWRCCRRCATAPPTSARRCRICSAARSASCGIAGDQQAATIGQGCFTPGMMKSTYGTGCFALLNTGADAGAFARTGCSPPSPISSTASAPMRWKARSSSPAPRCNGCATGCS